MSFEVNIDPQTDPQGTSPKWIGYVVTLLAEFVLVFALRELHNILPLSRLPIVYVLFIMAIAYIYGFGPALFGLIITLPLFVYFIATPIRFFWPPARTTGEWSTIIVLIIGTIIGAGAALAIRASRRRIQLLAESLKESNKRSNSILESITDGFFILDKEWRFTYVNQEAERLLNKQQNELYGKNIWEEFPVGIDTKLHQELQKAVEQQASIDLEVYSYIIGKWLEVRAYPFLYGLSVYFRDITERKNAEQLNRRYELLSKYARDIMLFVIRDGRIIEANNAAVDTYGYTRDELLSMNIYDLRTPENRPETRSQMEYASIEGILFETVHQRKDGTTFPVEVSVQGATIGDDYILLSIIRDISERKRAEYEVEQARHLAEEAAAHEAEARATIQAIINSAPIGIIVAEAETMEIYYYSPGVTEILGSAPTGNAKAPAAGSYEFLRPDGSPFSAEEMPLFRSLKYGEYTSNAEILIRRHDGSKVTVLVNSVPVRDTHDNITAAVASIDDITELANLRHTLERQVTLLQRALAPREVSIAEGYDVAVAYLPAYAGQEIGGDFYDVFETADGKTGILIGDVAGKGIEVAAFAAATRSTVHGFVHETSQPGNALTRANSVLYSQQPDFGSFVTAFLFLLDQSNGKITCSSAGHPPSIIYHANGELQLTDCGGQPPLALFSDMVYLESNIHIGPGDKLILFTDGITEARHGTELFEMEGIERVVREHGHKTAREITDEIIRAAREWSGGILNDDAAVVVIEREDCRGRGF